MEVDARGSAGPSPRRAADLARVEQLFGAPRHLDLEVAMSRWEFDLLRYSKRDGRYRDVTILIPYEGKLVCIAKHGYPPGIARPPSGGVVPGEPLDAAAMREAYEETGLRVRIDRYLVRVACWFTVDAREAAPPEHALAEASRRGGPEDFFDLIARYAVDHPMSAGAREYWESHVFWARAVGGELAPKDESEIREVVLVPAGRLEGDIHAAMRASGVGGFDYRVRLQETALDAARSASLL